MGYSTVGPDGEVEDVIFASEPPFRVTARVVTQLYGPRLGRSIHFKTHSHWGKRHLTNGNLKLVHLMIDGNFLLEPDENDTDVGVDSRGKLFVPVNPDPIHILPCGVDAQKQLVTATKPVSRDAIPLAMQPAPVMATPPDLQKKLEDEERTFFRINGGLLYPRYGIRLDDVARFLKAKDPVGEEFWCRSQ